MGHRAMTLVLVGRSAGTPYSPLPTPHSLPETRRRTLP